MKHTKKFILCSLCVALLLSAGACGKKDTVTEEELHNALNYAPLGAEHAQKDAALVAAIAGEKGTASAHYSAPPAIGVSYQYHIGNEGLVSVHNITSGNYDWTTHNDDGTSTSVNACGIRPCDFEGTQHIKLDRVAEYNYMLDISMQNDIIKSYTLTAYPVGNYDQGTTCTVKDGQLAVLKGEYYYEWIVHYNQGTATYGFFVD